ncbi:hypothetical protein JKP88DRAFT_289233 [Tribonema minus]|uniref:Uncharacterized protein n=1 Tax=Tribonema minus TaxID=303371 RepID=A0A835Z2Z7_9STRA|nr:hypothetical protein JKP88DRAFT_289233 [Tribonema minus]
MAFARNIDYPSLLASSGFIGIMFGSVALLNEADKGISNSFTFKNVSPSDVNLGRSTAIADAASGLASDTASATAAPLDTAHDTAAISTRSGGAVVDRAALDAAAEDAWLAHAQRRRVEVPSRGMTLIERDHKEVFLKHPRETVYFKAGDEITLYYEKPFTASSYLTGKTNASNTDGYAAGVGEDAKILIELSISLARELAERVMAYTRGARMLGCVAAPVSKLLGHSAD